MQQPEPAISAARRWRTEQSSAIQNLHRLTPGQRKRAFKALGPDKCSRLLPIRGPDAWSFWARGKQYWEPKLSKKINFYSAGRGWGKTLTGACAINLVARNYPERFGGLALLVGRTAADIRDIMVTGSSGIIATRDRDFEPMYEPSKRLITWPNGFKALLRSADAPEALRGPNAGITWCDEWAHWTNLEESWANVQLCCRVGNAPTHIITSTPLPLQIVRDLIAGKYGSTRVVYGHTMENVSGLAPSVVADLMRMWEGTSLGLQELGGMVLEQNEHAIWQQTDFAKRRILDEDDAPSADEMFQMAISIDPAGGGHRKPPAGKKRPSDETGLVLSGSTQEQDVYILDDMSGAMTTREWCQRTVKTVEDRSVDVVYVETNYGGEMVADALEQTEGWDECGARLVLITARRSKGDRARIAKGHYEKGKVWHVGPDEKYRKLEGQMCAYDPTLPRTRQDSPDRMDALVWGVLGHISDGEAGAGSQPRGRKQDEFWGKVQSESEEALDDDDDPWGDF